MSADRPVTPGDGITDAMVDAYDQAAHAARSKTAAEQIRAGLEAVVPLIRAQVAAELIAEAREVQLAIEDPATDTDTMGGLIDEAEGMWAAVRTVDEATWRREVEAAIKAGPPAPGTVRLSTRLRLALAQPPVITPAVPSTFASPVTYTATEGFYEPDEDPADVQAAFDAADKGVTRRPGEARQREER